jgi:hypothetical protein
MTPPSCRPPGHAHLALLLVLASLLAPATGAKAQAVVRSDENLESRRPEAWAMNYVAASTLMTAFGETPAMAAWRWRAAVDLGGIPRLSEEKQRVGLRGSKQEDLDKSPVFGRLRAAVGLPGGFVAELGYTPPVEIGGARPLDLFALAVGRRLLEHGDSTLSARVFGQHGRVRGDVTCPAGLAGVDDRARNPFGCRAPSRDRMALDYYGLDATAAWTSGQWHAYAGGGVARTEFAVQVDALTFEVRDRSRLTARGTMKYVAAGAVRDLDARWSLGAEVLYVPLQVRRESDGPVRNEAFTSLRVQLARRFD